MSDLFKEIISMKNGKKYYLNSLTGETRWGLPTYKNGKTLLPIGYERVMSNKELPGTYYYYNYIFGVNQWEEPKLSSIFSPTSTDDDLVDVSIGIPSDFRDVANSVTHLVVEDCKQNDVWGKMDVRVGKGSYGEVYVAKKDENSDYVVKIQNIGQQFFQEVMALQELQSTNVVPKLFAAWTCKKLGYIVIEKLTPISSYRPKMSATKIWKEVGSILDTIELFGWLHIDTSNSNVMVTNEGKLVLIDFGLSVKKTELHGNQTYPDHLYSKKYKRDLTWDQLKAFQDYKYEDSFNPCADLYSDSYTECSSEQEKQYQKANKKWKEILTKKV